MILLLVAGFALTLMLGQTFVAPDEVWRVLAGSETANARFTVWDLRLPRAVLAILTGMCFGIGGIAFQTMLRNPLASPDIIGISSGASAAAVFAIVVLSLSGPPSRSLPSSRGLSWRSPSLRSHGAARAQARASF